jgi:ADP-ribose pyrophosphatase
MYQNPWITVYEDRVQLPNGHTTLFGIVVPSTNFVGIVPLLDDDTVVMVRQYRYIEGKVTWEIPSGSMEAGETPQEAAQRELREEVGYHAKRLELLNMMRSNKSVMDDKGYIFLAEDLSVSPSKPDETEILEIVAIPFSKAIEMVKNSEIMDCVTIIGLLLVNKHVPS